MLKRLKKMLAKKGFSSEVGKYRVQVTGNSVQIFYKKEDSTFEVKQQINIGNRSDLADLFTAIGSVIDQYTQDNDQ